MRRTARGETHWLQSVVQGVARDTAKRKKVAALCLTVLFCVPAIRTFGQQSIDAPLQQIVVEGQVFDHNGAGVADVEVKLLAIDSPPGAPGPLAVARTNGFGDFRIRHDSSLSGAFVVEFTKAGYGPARREIEITAGQPPPFVDVLLSGALTRSGRVLDARDGTGVSAASVRVTAGGREWNVVTSAEGAFVVEQLLPGPATITVNAVGFARQRREIASMEDAETWQLSLGPERLCRIAVKDWRGKPIEGVRVEAIDDFLRDRWAGTTGADGVVVIRGLDPKSKELKVRLSHPGYVADAGFHRDLNLEDVTTDDMHLLSLLAAGRVAGKIINGETQRPLQGIRVSVGTGMDVAMLRAWTDFDGAYTISGVPPGDTIVTVYLRGYAPDLKRVDVKPDDEAHVDFAVVPSKEAKGVVVNEEGSPIAGAYLFATSWRGFSTLGVQTVTDGQGRFMLDTIPSDQFDVSVQAADYKPLTEQVIRSGKADHRFVMSAGPGAGEQVVALQKGDVFPSLELVTLDGKTIKTADLKGKTVLIVFWATWCGPCVAEIPHLVAVHTAFGDRDDFVMINISVDDDRDERKVQKLIRRHKMSWPQVFGAKSGAQQASEACGVQLLPTKFLISPDGKVLSSDLSQTTLKEAVAGYLPAQPSRKTPLEK
ncbi:MAG: carboxypeptidase regulatory-like domain-containing protein [Phycisphaerae bacterium]